MSYIGPQIPQQYGYPPQSYAQGAVAHPAPAPIGPVIPNNALKRKEMDDAAQYNAWERNVRPRTEEAASIGPVMPQSYHAPPAHAAPVMSAPAMPVAPVMPAMPMVNPALAFENPFLYQQQMIEAARLQRQALALEQRNKARANKVMRTAAGEVWEDPTLADWPKDDYRIFVGNLGNDVTDEALRKAFSQYKSLGRVRVVRDKKTGKTRGFGFVSLLDARDYVLAMKEMQGAFVMNRPCLLRKSDWAERNVEQGTKVKKAQLRKSTHAKPYKKPPLKPFFPTANNLE